jgi:hypothetical protein
MDTEMSQLVERIIDVRRQIAVLSLELSDLERKKSQKESNTNTNGKQLLQG